MKADYEFPTMLRIPADDGEHCDLWGWFHEWSGGHQPTEDDPINTSIEASFCISQKDIMTSLWNLSRCHECYLVISTQNTTAIKDGEEIFWIKMKLTKCHFVPQRRSWIEDRISASLYLEMIIHSTIVELKSIPYGQVPFPPDFNIEKDWMPLDRPPVSVEWEEHSYDEVPF